MDEMAGSGSICGQTHLFTRVESVPDIRGRNALAYVLSHRHQLVFCRRSAILLSEPNAMAHWRSPVFVRHFRTPDALGLTKPRVSRDDFI